MRRHPNRRCVNLEIAGFDWGRAATDTWDALLTAGVFVEGEFIFASNIHATLKADAERLYRHPKQLQVILGYFATFPCVQDADVLLYVPEGPRDFMTALGRELNKPVAYAKRRPDSTSKYDFIFSSPADVEIATSAGLAVIGEDVVTTLGSVTAMRRLLPSEQDVHSLAILRRGSIYPEYQADLVDHYLLEREIPTDKDEFARRLREEWS